MRTAHKSWKTYALGAAALTALLSATACEPDGTNNGTGTITSSATPSATASTQPGGGTGTGGGSQDSGGGSQDSGGGSGNSGGSSSTVGESATACSGANISVATTVYPHDSVRHLLLTATNTGDKECTLYRYPIVRFDNGREDQVGPMESEMKAVKIGPGKKAYAGMLLFRTGAPTEAVETMTVSLQGRISNADPDSGPIEVPLPDEANFLNIDDNPAVSYWNVSREKAENYMFKAVGGN
ncbi:DUF4232 domain-containing protein [Streptomyces sp. CA-210063]|uniref:DUF4232 domain-containing protein n=1 Tax=Streptomyces sp. CA-210063 TaxID=2801029 RepID=UPI00214D02A4|nr:DUF4232 domain-containing protein [Streptomyces sp. CA-210063]UUU35832.1 DUF4232 domain-containing protein [Streptomyces sp. CA-210063]